jgi:hypothetical protein
MQLHVHQGIQNVLVIIGFQFPAKPEAGSFLQVAVVSSNRLRFCNVTVPGGSTGIHLPVSSIISAAVAG